MSRSAALAIRILFLVWGVLMLLVGIIDLLAPRARSISSRPEPGGTLATAPAESVVTFSNELHPDSTIGVVSTMSLRPSGVRPYTAAARALLRPAV